jgi:hypothetical protein
MMRALILLAAFSLLIASGAFFVIETATPPPRPDWPALEDSIVKWGRFSELGDIGSDHFDFLTGIEVDPATLAAARLAVHYTSPDECLYLEISGRNLSLVVVRMGRHRVLAGAEMPAPLSPGVEHGVSLRRRGSLLVAVVDGSVRLAAFAPEMHGGRAAIGVNGTGFRFLRPVVSDLDPVMFNDDFMRSEGAPSPWQMVSGAWKTESLRDGSMSANAFRFSGQGAPAIAIAGQDTWDNYSFAAGFSGAPGGRVGLIFACVDEANYCVFRWGARDRPVESSLGRAELVRVRGGVEQVLTTAQVGYMPDQWYRGEIRMGFGWAEVYVDEQLLLSVLDPALAGGRVGLWCSGEGACLFDDVKVSEATFFREDFIGPASTWKSWDVLGGVWEEASGQDRQGLEFSAGPDGGVRVFGSPRWGNYSVAAQLAPDGGRCGLIYHYRDAASYSCLVYDSVQGALELVSRRGGQEKVLDRCPARLDGGMHSFEVYLDRGLTRALVNGRHSLSAWETDSTDGGYGLSDLGRVGLAVWGGRALAGGIGVQLSGDIEPLPSINPIFASDREMLQWSSWQGEWYEQRSGSGAKAHVVRWHRARFPGDVAMLVELAKAPEKTFELLLSVGKDGEKPGNGYIMKLSRAGTGAADDQPVTLVLTRDGETVAQGNLDGVGRIWTVSLRRAGSFLLGSVNSRQALFYCDPQSLSGSKVAWSANGIEADGIEARVYSPSVVNYPFSSAPSDWRVGAGLWEVTNRWQCDPRWSFFSGRSVSFKDSPLTPAENALPEPQRLGAVLWNKRQFGGSVVLEFYAGIKMLRQRGNRYEYARDVNCTIGADGRDPASGYSFLFGGFDNARSSILRRGVEVAKTPSGSNNVIPRDANIHHRWFYVRAERSGGQLHFSVDGGKVLDLSYDDPEPLTGDRVAIWTWDCGLMISHVRISGDPARGMEALDFVPGSVITSPYSK